MTNNELNEQREQHDARINNAESHMKSGMTNAQTIDRWAEHIIPVVFRAEDDLQKAVPEWKERLAALNAGTSKEDGTKVAKEYCQAIARIIVTQGSDYVPDGSIDGEADFT